MRRAAAAALVGAFAAVTAGCGGGGGDPHPALAQTAAKLGSIRSGDLSLSLRVDPRGQGGEFGFELSGPFSLGKSGSLPVANLRYTQIANDRQATATLISTGSKAYVRIGDTAYELPSAQTAELRSATNDLRTHGGLARLRIGDWIKDPQLSDGGRVGGADTDHVHSTLDTAAAVDDLLEVSRGFGSSIPSLDAGSLKRLVSATRSATLDLYTGKRDRLLRKLSIDADFGLSVPEALASALGATVGAEVRFDLEIAHPNSRVRVEAPRHARPSSEFPQG
jgi:hypothetical protein